MAHRPGSNARVTTPAGSARLRPAVAPGRSAEPTTAAEIIFETHSIIADNDALDGTPVGDVARIGARRA